MKKFEKKPFALIGVNVMALKPAQLKEVMVKENLPWRSIADLGSIAPKWNSPGTPVYYVIDGSGVIHYKWVGYPGIKAIENGIETALQGSESKSSGTHP